MLASLAAAEEETVKLIKPSLYRVEEAAEGQGEALQHTRSAGAKRSAEAMEAERWECTVCGARNETTEAACRNCRCPRCQECKERREQTRQKQQAKDRKRHQPMQEAAAELQDKTMRNRLKDYHA
eukprot:gene16932-302_t